MQIVHLASILQLATAGAQPDNPLGTFDVDVRAAPAASHDYTGPLNQGPGATTVSYLPDGVNINPHQGAAPSAGSATKAAESPVDQPIESVTS